MLQHINAWSELTGNFEISFVCVYLHIYGNKDDKMDSGSGFMYQDAKGVFFFFFFSMLW